MPADEKIVINTCSVYPTTRKDSRVFSIGPFGDKINFLSQQHRSFELIEALHNSNKSFSSSQILIIGAGLAGITTATALKYINANPIIYEKEVGVFRRQKSSYHRYVHPNVNFWPFEERHDPTTSLPYLNWHVGHASTVSNDISEKWRKLEIPFKKLHEVEKVVQENDKVKVTFKNGGGENKTKTYDYVFCCTGFGEDNSQSEFGIPGYWDVDDNFHQRVILARSSNKCIAVSGIGDGGLIEVFDLLYGAEGAGEIIIKLFSQIKNNLTIKAAISLAEIDVNNKNLSDSIIDEYKNILEYMPDDVRDVLDLSYKRAKELGGAIKLFGYNCSHPSIGRASPLHKILITDAIEKGACEYVNIDTKITQSNIEEFKTTYGLEIIIPRHNSTRPLEKLLADDSAFDLEDFLGRQKHLAPYVLHDAAMPKEAEIEVEATTFMLKNVKNITGNFHINDEKILLNPKWVADNTPRLSSSYGCCETLIGYKIFGYEIALADGSTFNVNS